jgi:hypothetical protein
LNRLKYHYEICNVEQLKAHSLISFSFPAVDAACDLMLRLFTRSDIYAVVAEVGGQIVGSNFLWEETIDRP